MLKKILAIGLAVVVVAGLVGGFVTLVQPTVALAAGPDGPSAAARGGRFQTIGDPAVAASTAPDNKGRRGGGRTPLSEIEVEGLIMAIEEEYGARALYQSVLDAFGQVSPFVEITRSEQRHIDALVKQFDKYGVPIPEPPEFEAPVFDSLSEACQAGVAAEIADAALYDELIPVTEHEDLIRVYTRLQDASLSKHLPAFEDCQ